MHFDGVQKFLEVKLLKSEQTILVDNMSLLCLVLNLVLILCLNATSVRLLSGSSSLLELSSWLS